MILLLRYLSKLWVSYKIKLLNENSNNRIKYEKNSIKTRYKTEMLYTKNQSGVFYVYNSTNYKKILFHC